MEKEDRLIINIGLIFLLIFGIGGYWYSYQSDYGCMLEKSNIYCIENGFNGTDSIFYPVFTCYNQSGDERKGFENTTERFYFTELEQKECGTNESKSWRRN